MQPNTFFRTFRYAILFSSFCGMYVPDSELLLPQAVRSIARKLFMVFSVIALVVYFINIAETWIYLTGDIAIGDFYLCLTASFIFLLLLCKLLYVMLNRSNLTDMFAMWEVMDETELFREQRQELILKEKELVYKLTRWQFRTLFFPCLLWSLLPFVTQKLARPLGFPAGHDQHPWFYVSVGYQILCATLCAAGWTAFDSIQTLFMSSVVAELKFLQLALAKIFEVSPEELMHLPKSVSDYPVVLRTQNSCVSDTEAQLKAWINHHVTVIRYNEKIRQLYSLPNCMSYAFLCFCSCILSFAVAKKILLIKDAMICTLFVGANMAIFFVICWFGDRIKFQSVVITEEMFTKNWYTFSKMAKRSLNIIITRVRAKHIQIDAYTLLPLGAHSFLQLLKTTYTFYAAISSVQKNESD